jgi:hypothetical protein
MQVMGTNAIRGVERAPPRGEIDRTPLKLDWDAVGGSEGSTSKPIEIGER